MRSIVTPLLLAFLLLASLLAFVPTNVSAIEHNGAYDSWSDWEYVALWSNQSGSYVELSNNTTWPVTSFFPVGTIINFSTCSFWLNSSSNQRVDVLISVEDNDVEVFSQQWLNTPFTTPGPDWYVFTSDWFNITTVHGHTYDIEWHYRFHTIIWNSWLTGSSPLTDDVEAFITTVEEPVPTSDTASWWYVNCYWYPNSAQPVSVKSFPASPTYGVQYIEDDDAISGVVGVVLVGCNENVRLESQCFFYVDTVLYAWDNQSDIVTPGYTPVPLLYASALAFSYDAQAQVPYYFIIGYALYDGNNTTVASGQFSVTICVTPTPPTYVGWVDAIVWCAIIFAPGLIIAHWLGRWGLIVGIVGMSVVALILAPDFMLMSFIALITSGIMAFSVSRE
jgi:hypothetical protein